MFGSHRAFVFVLNKKQLGTQKVIPMIETQREMTGLLMTLIDPYLQYVLDTIGEVIKEIPDKPFIKTSLKCKKCFSLGIECAHRYSHVLSIINPKTINNHIIQKPVKNQYYNQSKYFYDQMFKLIELKYHEYSKTNKNQVKLGNIQKQFLRKCPPFCYYCQFCGETERGYQKPKHKQSCKLYVPIRLLSELEWSESSCTQTRFTLYQRERYFEINGDYKKRNKSGIFEKQKLMVKSDLKLYDMKNKVGNCIGVFINGVLEAGDIVGSPLTPTSEKENASPAQPERQLAESMHTQIHQSFISSKESRFKRIKIDTLLNHDEDVSLLLNFAEMTRSS
ncbi:hypothetical protein HDV06_006600 [Boothiomyces sp. JEL0866]|nr:hypothetical protein HDV06_006600 [Boothiomyces sp. JEL0866]